LLEQRDAFVPQQRIGTYREVRKARDSVHVEVEVWVDLPFPALRSL